MIELATGGMIELATAVVVLATAVVALATLVLVTRAKRRVVAIDERVAQVDHSLTQVHVLVDGRLTETIARVNQLTAALEAAGGRVPPAESPHFNPEGEQEQDG